MNRIIRIGKNIYPDLDTMDEVNKVLKERFEIEIGFLFDDGIEFIFPEDRYDTYPCPGNLSWYDPVDKTRVLTYTEDFGVLRFTDRQDKELLTIPILEDNLW